MSISICVPTYNRLPQLQCLLESIFEGFGDYPYEVIVADGGSTDGTLEYLRGLANVTLIEMGELTGAVKAYNACFKLTKCEYTYWPNDDFVLVPRVLIKACELMDGHEEIGLVAPKLQEPTLRGLPNVGVYFDYLVTSKVHIFRTSVLREIGYLDESFRTYKVDVDSCLAVLDLGHTIAFTREVGAIHNRVQGESRALNRAQAKEKATEGEYYREKWAGLRLSLEDYMKSSPARRYRSRLFRTLCWHMWRGRLARPIVDMCRVLAAPLYDRFLEQYAAFKVKKYEHLKDFHLVQRLPREVLSSTTTPREPRQRPLEESSSATAR